METCVVEVPRASALVKRVHIMPLKIRFRAKKRARMITSMAFSPVPRLKRFAMEVAKVVVRVVVVLEEGLVGLLIGSGGYGWTCIYCHWDRGIELETDEWNTYSFANTPLKAAQAPLMSASAIHCDFRLRSLNSISLACSVAGFEESFPRRWEGPVLGFGSRGRLSIALLVPVAFWELRVWGMAG